jgi:hypothetical protein
MNDSRYLGKWLRSCSRCRRAKGSKRRPNKALARSVAHSRVGFTLPDADIYYEVLQAMLSMDYHDFLQLMRFRCCITYRAFSVSKPCLGLIAYHWVFIVKSLVIQFPSPTRVVPTPPHPPKLSRRHRYRRLSSPTPRNNAGEAFPAPPTRPGTQGPQYAPFLPR